MPSNNKLVAGVGINDADYPVVILKDIGVGKVRKRKQLFCCEFYRVWSAMLNRCYSRKQESQNPTYKGCTVCEDWLTFSNFKKWMELQDYVGKCLDKDLMVKGNKIYSPSTCVFLPPAINNFMFEPVSKSGLPLGVSYKVSHSKFCAQIRDPFTKKQRHLGLFENASDAHEEWKRRKLEYAIILSKGLPQPVAAALILRYT